MTRKKLLGNDQVRKAYLGEPSGGNDMRKAAARLIGERSPRSRGSMTSIACDARERHDAAGVSVAVVEDRDATDGVDRPATSIEP